MENVSDREIIQFLQVHFRLTAIQLAFIVLSVSNVPFSATAISSLTVEIDFLIT